MGIETIIIVLGLIIVAIAWRAISKARRTTRENRSPTDPTIRNKANP